MTGTDAVDPADQAERAHPPALRVVAGLTYSDRSQLFKRWFLPTYQKSFRWTGNRSDAEEATTWVFKNAVSRLRLPELVSAVDQRVADATLEAASRHWSDHYGIDPVRCAQINACESNLSARPALSLEALAGGLSAELRLVIVLRFLRKRPLSTIAAQLGVPAGTANARLYMALSTIAGGMGLDARPSDLTQADQVATFVDHLVDRRKPPRFEVTPPAWAALVAAAHLQAAVAGNNLPRAPFVRSLQATFRTGGSTRFVTQLRIWSA